LASAFASMAISGLSTLTVGEYVALAQRYHELSGGAPWYEPFLVKGVMDQAPSRNGTSGQTEPRYSSTLNDLK
jgi:hypothetical protein